MIPQARGAALGLPAPERGQAPTGRGASLLEWVPALEGRERRVDQRGGHAAGAQLGAEARGAVPPRRAGLDPLARKGRVVHVAASDEIGDHLGRDGPGCTPAHEARRQLAAGPGAPGQEVARGEARGAGVEDASRRSYRLKKLLPDGVVMDRSSRFSSNVCSPVEKMPRTLRSKSSALVAASRAVSYEIMPSR